MRIAEGEHATVARVQEVALAGSGRQHAEHWRVQSPSAGRPVELGVAEREHAAVARDLPIAVARGRRRHTDDRAREAMSVHATVIARVAEREHGAVGRRQPVPGTGRVPGDRRDARVHTADRRKAAECEHLSDVGGDPVSTTGQARGNARANCRAASARPLDPGSRSQTCRGDRRCCRDLRTHRSTRDRCCARTG